MADQNRPAPASSSQMARQVIVLDCPQSEANPQICAQLVQVLAQSASGGIIRLNPDPRPPQATIVSLRLSDGGANPLRAQLSWVAVNGASGEGPLFQTNQPLPTSGQARQNAVRDFAREIVQNTPDLLRMLAQIPGN